MADETYRNIIEQIARTKSSSVTVFADFCRISACALAAGSREEEYFETIKPYSKSELKQFAKAFALMVQEAESKPYIDVLGSYYLEIASLSSKQARGEFYTPAHLCELMAQINAPAVERILDTRPVTVSDPCCGSGNMILAFAKQFSPLVQDGEKSYVDSIRATCQDINPVAVDMCYINTTLWGIPAKIILGNALSKETPQNIWNNIHWFRVGAHKEEKFERMKNLISEIITEKKPTPQQSFQAKYAAESDSSPRSQGEFDFDLGSVKSDGKSR